MEFVTSLQPRPTSDHVYAPLVFIQRYSRAKALSRDGNAICIWKQMNGDFVDPTLCLTGQVRPHLGIVHNPLAFYILSIL